jgi:hypothetical protein
MVELGQRLRFWVPKLQRSHTREKVPEKRQRTAALQDAVPTDWAPLIPQGFGVRLSSAALIFDQGTTSWLKGKT